MLKKLFLISLFILSSATMFAATYYVDSNVGNDANSGTSVTSPWSTISKVNGTTFNPGDQILFKKGTTWFNTTLNVTSSGTSTAPIVYGSYGSGELPVLDGTRTLQNICLSDAKDYVTIQEIRFINANGEGTVRIKNGTGVKVQNCEFLITAHGGVFLQATVNAFVLNNKMWTPEGNLAKQTDGVYIQRTTGTIVDGNNIVISNTNLDEHCDGIQSFQDTDVTIRNNYIEQINLKTYNSQGIYMTEGSGTNFFYNNVVKCPNTHSSVMGYDNITTTGTVRAYGNTLIGGGSGVFYIKNDPGLVAKNNIIIGLTENPPAHFTVNPAPGNLDNNLYKSNSESVIFFEGTNGILTMAQLKALGYEASGKNADPLLNADYTPMAGSPVVDAGNNLGGIYAVDRLGIARPQGSGSDIGAYEFVVKSDTIAAPDQQEVAKTGSTAGTPSTYELAQNFPNPFNPTTVIKYALPKDTEVSVKVYDILGSQVADLFNGVQTAGSYQLNFNAANLSSGTYIYMIKTKDFTESKKMILLK